MDEYRQVLARPKFSFAPTLVDSLLDYLSRESLQITAVPSGIVLPDPSDSPFLDVALTAKAKVLVTGNLKHFEGFAPGLALKIMNPATFLAGYHKVAK